ncbi:MAG TPA: helix-turn-helix transcriptional regulator [Anaeromyxobacteraceae bacterium]|nr:helix-turn-helix transcriptional regulator [Anaeromyxobacteraceae bacterium]
MTQDQKAPSIGRFEAPRAPDDDPAAWRKNPIPSLVMAAVAVLAAFDVADDLRAGGEWGHVALELAVVAVASAGAVILWWQLVRARTSNRALRADLDAARADLERFRGESQELMRGLGEAIDRQFERWQLSPAEREVALLLLKGLSHKDVADVRRTSERTVRQQALAVYRKAGLSGRAELAAFFLEDLLLPIRAGAAGGT